MFRAPPKFIDTDFSPAEIAECAQKNGLLSIDLETNAACNLRCTYCYASSGKAQPGGLGLDDFRRVVDEAVALGARVICLVGGGEPLLYPHISELIGYIRAAGAAVVLITNAMLVTPELAAQLYAAEVSVIIKKDSLEESVQDRIAGVRGSARRMEQGLANLCAAGYPSPVHQVAVHTVVARSNLAEIPAIWRWARLQGYIPLVEMPIPQGRARERLEYQVSPEAVHRLFERLATLDRTEFGYDWNPLPPIAGSECKRHYYSCLVTWSGEVAPCTSLPVPVGDVKAQSLPEILGSHPLIGRLRHMQEHLHGACAACVEDCYGCRARAFHLTGDPFASDHGCWLATDQTLAAWGRNDEAKR